jgi:hypothetical protein
MLRLPNPAAWVLAVFVGCAKLLGKLLHKIVIFIYKLPRVEALSSFSNESTKLM